MRLKRTQLKEQNGVKQVGQTIKSWQWSAFWHHFAFLDQFEKKQRFLIVI